MTVVGFHFTKILVEKTKSGVGKIDISNNVTIKGVKEVKLNMGASKKAGAEFNFEFISKYSPGVGSILIEGKLVFMDNDEASVKKALDQWKKEEKVPKDIIPELYNHILTKCNVEAIVLSRDMQLPPPIPLPKVKKD